VPVPRFDVVLAVEEACTNVIRHSASSQGMALSVMVLRFERLYGS
jgi:anti-sigma regulatory factor (Ser/Thr protein kinase)